MAQAPSTPEPEHRGHNLKCVIDPSLCSEYICGVCKDVCRDGVEDDEGDPFCLVRIHSIYSLFETKHSYARTQLCLQSTRPKASYHPSKFIRRAVLRIRICCPKHVEAQENATYVLRFLPPLPLIVKHSTILFHKQKQKLNCEYREL